MSEAFDRGRDFENKVRKIMSAKLKSLEIKRDKQSGAGIHKMDIRDRYGELPLFIECKDHKTTKLKEWWREADAKSNFGQHATVVFPDNEEVLAVIRFEDLLDLVQTAIDWKATADDYRDTPSPSDPVAGKAIEVSGAVMKKVQQGARVCYAGHIADSYGYCMQKDCKYSRGYRPPKKAKK